MMVGVRTRDGDPSPIFEKTTITTSTRDQTCPEQLHSESIVHRLNHLSLLINSSGIDLNIAFDESVYESAASEAEMLTADNNSTLASLSSQSTKRRSVMPQPKADVLQKEEDSVQKSTSKSKASNISYMCKDGLLDAFLALYDECCTNEKYKKDALVQDFIKKYQPYAAHLSKLRVSLSDFECVRVIGRGHFGVVQLVKELSTGNVYALKTLRKDETLQQKHVAFFEEERDIMAKATSPWITRLQYAFQDSRHLHLVMEYHPGGDLLSLMERHQAQQGTRCLPQDWVVFYMAQTATALHHLHAMGYVHRDVKPDNLLLDRCGHVKLADFGSSCRVGADGRVTASLPAGTPDYVAPEVLAAVDGGAGYGVSCDFWSAGIVAFEMLYGDTPFASEKVVCTYSNIMQHEDKLLFPAKEGVDATAVDLLKALLCPAPRRLDYRGLTLHPFFLHCDWNALDLMVPPVIPTVSAPDDSSNFDSFSEADMPSAGGATGPPDVTCFRSDCSTIGRRVPFVGFTFVRPPLGEAANKTRDSTHAGNASLEEKEEEINRLRSELLEKKKKLHELQLQSTQDAAAPQPDAPHTKGRLLLLEKEREKLRSALKKKESVIAALKERLEAENAERAAVEERVLTLIRDVKAKWKREEEARLAQVTEECGFYKDALSKEYADASEKTVKLHELQQQHNVLQQQLQHCKRQALVKDKEIVKLQQRISDLEQGLSAAHAETKKIDSVQHSAAAAEVELVQSQLASACEERDALRDKVKKLQNECDKMASVETELQGLKAVLADTESKFFEDMQSLTQAHDKALSTKAALVQELQSSLQAERQEKCSITSQLQSVQLQLQEARASQAKAAAELQEMQEAKQEEVQEVRKQLDQAQHSINEHERQASVSQKALEESQKRVTELESAMQKLEQSRAERQSSSELQSLAEQLSRAREAAARAEENAKNVTEQLEKEQSEAGRLRLDLKLKERELKSAQEKIEFLRECARENREAIKDGQVAVKEQQQEVQQLQQRIAELQQQVGAGEEALRAQEIQYKEEATKLQERIAALQDTVSSGSKVSTQLAATRAELDQLRLSKRGVESSLEASQQEVRKTQERVQQLEQQLADRDAQIVKLNEGTTLLKDLCSEQDEQLSQLEAFEARMDQQRRERTELEEQVSRLQTDLKAARAQANEEKSLKAFQERQVKSLQTQLQDQERHQDQILAALHQEADQIRAQNTKLTARISELEKAVYDAECTVQTMEESAEGIKTQLELLKEEAQGHIKHIQALKESNFQLTQGLEEAVEKGHIYKRKVEELGGKLEEERQVHRDQDMRNKMTTEQQTKLIDFLHSKLDDKTKKKKTLSSKLFGSGRDKENQDLTPYKTRTQGTIDPTKCTLADPHPSPASVEQCKLLKTPSSTLPPPPKTPSSAALSRQQSASLKVPFQTRSSSSTSQFKTPKDPFKTPSKDHFKTPSRDQSKTASSRDVFKTPSKDHQSKASSKSLATPSHTPASSRSRDHSLQRIRHNIPHRFERSMVVQGGRCSGCLSSVPRGRFAYRCTHCSLLAHKHCCPGVPPTCGLPQELALHFAAEHGTPSSSAAVVHEGWVKIPKSSKACWEFCFARLLSSGDLLVFDHEPSDAGDCSLAMPSSATPAAAAVPELQPTSTVCLCPAGCTTEVVTAVPRSEIPATSTIDLPFVLKVDVTRGYQQSVERLYIMTTNFEQKQRWVAALELTIKRCSDAVSIADDGSSSVQVQHLLQLPAPAPTGHGVSPNSIIFMDQSVCLVGCSEGVLSCSVGAGGELTKKALLGTLTAVHQLLDIPSVAHVAAIAGPDRSLYTLPHRPLLTAASHCTEDEPAVPHEAVEGLAGVRCHLLAAGVTSSGVTFVCAAAEDRISILSWDTATNQLKVVRQYGTQEACTSCLFTPAALIVAADKLYEIDLTSFSIEEFLDESDTSLAYAVYGTAHLSSFPLAILQVSESGKYGEFLVCFSEFALFVDPYGQRSREHDIKFTRVPVAIEYCQGKLYLLHSNSVEVLHIRSDSFTKVSTSSRTSQEFDTSSIGPTCAAASLALCRPTLLGRRNESIIVRCDGEAGASDVLQLTGHFPQDDLSSSSWSSLPSTITGLHTDIPDSASVSSGVYSLGDGEQTTDPQQAGHRGDKRKQDGGKQVTFSANRTSAAAITKRSKRDIAQ